MGGHGRCNGRQVIFSRENERFLIVDHDSPTHKIHQYTQNVRINLPYDWIRHGP